MSQDRAPHDRKNILVILVDQLRFPRFSYGPDHGFAQPIKLVTGFQEPGRPDELDPAWAEKYFPALWSLRQHSVVLRRHRVATSACTPSRAVMMTGQYGTRTGVTQTDGTFKNGDSPAFPWLSPAGIPTIGSWMREAGYSTHYFGKWHVSNPPEHDLRRYGFDDWELSYPEPHGTLLNNLGMYRDHQFADLGASFLRRRGLGVPFARFVGEENYADPLAVTARRAAAAGYGPELTGDAGDAIAGAARPWFAVVSFTNPHDIAAYPALPRQIVAADNFPSGAETYAGYLRAPLGVPDPAWRSAPPAHGTMRFALNPLGFPQGSGAANVPPTLFEDLSTKPRCQYDYSYKMGLTLAAKLGWATATGGAGPNAGTRDLPELWALAAEAMALSGLPFQRQDLRHASPETSPEAWARAFIQYYAYLVHVVDQHIARVLAALRDSGQDDNTIVVVMADHGEYGGAHGMMMEKWHTAYEEALHVPVVIHSADLNAEPNMKQCDALTSHIDLVPTILGLAGVDAEQRARIRRRLQARHEVPELVGCDLAPLIEAVGKRATPEPTAPEAATEAAIEVAIDGTGAPRRGVLFITDDEITAPLANNTPDDPHSFRNQNEYEAYKLAVRAVAADQHKAGERAIADGSVIQPNHVRCVVTRGHKLARYWDPSGHAADEWELYDLERDPNEIHNLLAFDRPFPTAAANLPAWAGGTAEVEAQARDLRVLLAELETRML
ncbi:MAG TPA: sulfatase-like hydrolase/transferase [Kofleriaceae bacterium]|jgi:arylsulfatase A-like enzyme|nr:sulfatase-like hydrolase/transferase [Kofleriaceae bacterium]